MNTPAPQGGRTAYHTPVLRDHGTVAEITLASGSEVEVLDNAGYSSSAPSVTS